MGKFTNKTLLGCNYRSLASKPHSGIITIRLLLAILILVKYALPLLSNPLLPSIPSLKAGDKEVSDHANIEVSLLPSPINTAYHDFSPSVSADNKILVFNSNRPGGVGSTDLYECVWQGDRWSSPRNLAEINSNEIDETPFISANGQTLFFASNRSSSLANSSDIYVSKRVNERWTRPVSLGSGVNSALSEKTPSLSPDGSVLLFTRYPQGRIEQAQVMASINSDGRFGSATSLPAPVNMGAMDSCPVFHPHGTGLFFSSFRQNDRWDIYWVPFQANNKMGEARPLPSPVNSDSFEAFFSITQDGSRIYFSRLDHNASGDSSNYNIYWVNFAQVMQKLGETKKLIIRFFDSQTKKSLSAQYSLKGSFKEKADLERQDAKENVKGEGNLVELESIPNHFWELEANRRGYMPYQDIIQHDRNQIDIFMIPIEEGSKVVLPNMEFDFDQAKLSHKSKQELEKVYQFLQKHPKLIIEISGHTDSLGENEHNMELSKKRAQAVRDFLIAKGIAEGRLTAVGYGSSQPIADNDSEESRQKNRRTEMKIVKKNE